MRAKSINLKKAAPIMAELDFALDEDEKAAIREGRTFLLREQPAGRAGDVFSADGRRFEIVDVSERTLGSVADRLFVAAGYDSTEGFIVGWEAARGRWDPDQKIYVCWFRPAPADGYSMD